jgi:hypothetical protein
MSVRYEHPGFGVAFRLDEHGGDAEIRDAKLYDEWYDKARKAVREIAAEPAYAGMALDEADYEPITKAATHKVLRTCPVCRSVVDAPGGVLADHQRPLLPPARCVGSGWTVKGEHQ